MDSTDNKNAIPLDGSKYQVTHSPIKYRAGKDLKLEVIRFNPLKTQISIEESSSQLFMTDTSNFSKYIVLPKSTEVPADAAKDLSLDKAKTKCENLTKLVSALNLQNTSIISATLDFKTFLSRVENINDSYKNLQQLNALAPDNVKTELQNNFISTLNNFISTNSYLKAKGVGTLNTDPSKVMNNQVEAIEQILFQRIQDEFEKIKSIEKDAQQLPGTDCKLATYAPILDKFTTTLASIKEDVFKFNTSYTDKVYPAFKKTLGVYQSLNKWLTTLPSFASKYVPIYNDEHLIKIYGKDLDQEKTLRDEIRVEPVRGWKLDVAGGVFVSGLADELYTRKTKDSIYTKQHIVDGAAKDTLVQETFTTIRKQDQNKVGFGGMLYMHAHSQTGSYINYGISLGFGALFNDQARWAGSIGPSLLVGKKQRLNITPGLIIGQVDRLSAPYAADTWYPEKIDNVPTYKAWKTSWMIGLSWNFK